MSTSSEEIWALFRETDRQMKDTDRRLQKLDALVTRVSKQLGDLGNRLGEFVEYMVEPALVRLFQAQGLDVHEVHQNVEIRRDGMALEIDLLVVNDGTMVCVECKSKLTREHVDEHIARLGKLRRMMPAYRSHHAMGAVAAMVLPQAVARYAMAQGLYVLAQNGDHVEVRNPPSFQPTIW